MFTAAYPWFSREELAAPPSVLDGLAHDEERRLAHHEPSALVADVGHRLGADPAVVATASVYLHVFYLRRSVQRFDAPPTAVACLVLAGEAEGRPVDVREGVAAFWAACGGPQSLEARLLFRESVEERTADLREALGGGAAPAVRHPHGFLRLLLRDVYGADAVLPGRRGPVTVQALANASAFAINDALRTVACVQHRPEAVAAAAFWIAHRVLGVGEPLVTSPVAGGAFVPWHRHWLVDHAELREVAREVAGCVGPHLAAALGEEAPPPRRVAHTRPRVSPADPSGRPVPVPRGVQPCPRCKVLFTRDEYGEHRAACKAAHHMCLPCGAVHADDVQEHRARCRVECGSCGDVVLAAALPRHREACGREKRRAARAEAHTPPAGPGQKRFRPSPSSCQAAARRLVGGASGAKAKRRKSGDAARTA